MSEPWYKEGLRFSCTGCGKCCTGAPGYVWVNQEEIQEMANHLNITPKEFTQRYVRQVGGRLSLKENALTYDCIFLEGKTCKLYQSRPTQCRTFPFWPQNLESKESWEAVKSECEGIDEGAPLVSREKIETERLIQLKRNHTPCS